MAAVPGHPGLLVVRGMFTHAGERAWVRRCLREYTVRGNVTNLDVVHGDVHGDSGSIWVNAHAPRARSNDEGGAISADKMLRKLRWTTLGYHYDWTNKVSNVVAVSFKLQKPRK